MKKTVAISLIAVFLISLVPLAFAGDSSELETDDRIKTEAEVEERVKLVETSSDSERLRAKTAILEDAVKADLARCMEKCRLINGTNCEARCRVADKDKDITDKAEDRLDKIEDWREKNREKLEKLSYLSQKQIDKLSELEIKNVEKIAQLNRERLMKMAELSEDHVKRLSGLTADKFERISDLDKADLEKLAVMNHARLEKFSGDDIKKLKEELKSMRIVKVKNSDDLALRNLTDEEIEALKDRYEAARKKFDEAKDELESIRDELKQAKERKDNEGTIQYAKEYLMKTADTLVSHLEKIKVKVQESTYISDEREAEIVAEIDAQIGEINAIKAEAEAATTKEQVKAAAKKLRAKWSRLQHWVNFYSERVILARVEGIVNNGEVLEKKLENILERAENAGIEVNLTEEINGFSAQIALAKDKSSQGQAKLAEAWALKARNESGSDEIKSLVEEANAFLKEARDALKDAHEILRDIIKKLKEAYPEADLSDELEVEIVQEIEVED